MKRRGFWMYGFTGIAGIAVAILAVLSFTIGPILLIWALNQLFSLSITYTFWNWLAGFILLALLRWGWSK